VGCVQTNVLMGGSKVTHRS